MPLRAARWLALVLLIATAAALFDRAESLRLEHGEGLSTLNAALRCVGQADAPLAPHLSALPVLVQLPAMHVRHAGSVSTPYVLAHMSSLLITVLGVLCCVRLARASALPTAAWLAGVLLLWNRVVLHHAPFALPVGPALVAVPLALLAVRRAHYDQRLRMLLLAGVALGVAGAADHHALALIPAAALFWVMPNLRLFRVGKDTVKALPPVLITAGIAWAAIYAALGWAAGLPVLEALNSGFSALEASGEITLLEDPSTIAFYPSVLALSGGWAGALLACGGAALAVRQRGLLQVLVLVWVGVALLTLSVDTPREARHLAPLLVGTTYLQALALDRLLRMATHAHSA
ncbi:hypothetical protein OAX78_04375, partial [Planctomycetota bacterium]|nr:hypothetical protein [Planctomycetota bacterium]